jgi:dimethylhistidine N-methyltransferase
MSDHPEDFARALHQALGTRPRVISPKYFYDEAGSALFDRICELPEYYPTRTEWALLTRHAPEMARCIGADAELIEYGAGSTRKIGLLLQALQRPRRFVAVDLSADHLHAALARLRQAHPALDVVALVADFTRPLSLPLPASPGGTPGRRVGFFPGSSIGNFTPEQARGFLAEAAQSLRGGGLLIGVDLVKDPQRLHQAYNDAAGVTAAFNRNLLVRANRELGCDFKVDQFAHYAFYDPRLQRIEMHLVSRRAQHVHLQGRRYDFDEGETWHTEISCKYTVGGFQALARSAGFDPQGLWSDDADDFAVFWLASPA